MIDYSLLSMLVDLFMVFVTFVAFDRIMIHLDDERYLFYNEPTDCKSSVNVI